LQAIFYIETGRINPNAPAFLLAQKGKNNLWLRHNHPHHQQTVMPSINGVFSQRATLLCRDKSTTNRSSIVHKGLTVDPIICLILLLK